MFGVAQSDQKAECKSWTIGDCNRVQVVDREFILGQAVGDDALDVLAMQVLSDGRDDATISARLGFRFILIIDSLNLSN